MYKTTSKYGRDDCKLISFTGRSDKYYRRKTASTITIGLLFCFIILLLDTTYCVDNMPDTEIGLYL